jgi:hypothetical protein
MEWNCIIGIPIKNPLDNLFVPKLLSPRFTFLDAILRLELPKKKKISHTTNLHCCIYEEKEIISRTFLTTKEKLDIVASKNLSTSISSCKNKNEIKRNVLNKKWKKGHLETKYLMLESCVMQPFVKLGVRKLELGEFFGLP